MFETRVDIRGNIFNRGIFSRRVVKSYVKSVPRNLTNATLWTAHKFWSVHTRTRENEMHSPETDERYLLERDDKGRARRFSQAT